MRELIKNCEGFLWDEGNIDKNWIKHKVTHLECEEIFFNLPLLVSDDLKHSNTEKRYYALGKSKADRCLFISFTIRNNLIRVISARDMNRKERMIYEEKIEKNTKI
jgi:uncharacterized DUF497 family protein